MSEDRTRVDIHAAGVILGPKDKPTSRSTIYRRLGTDKTFPRPFFDGYRLQWFEDELRDYVARLSRRQYRGNQGEAAAAP